MLACVCVLSLVHSATRKRELTHANQTQGTLLAYAVGYDWHRGVDFARGVSLMVLLLCVVCSTDRLNDRLERKQRSLCTL